MIRNCKHTRELYSHTTLHYWHAARRQYPSSSSVGVLGSRCGFRQEFSFSFTSWSSMISHTPPSVRFMCWPFHFGHTSYLCNHRNGLFCIGFFPFPCSCEADEEETGGRLIMTATMQHTYCYHDKMMTMTKTNQAWSVCSRAYVLLV